MVTIVRSLKRMVSVCFALFLLLTAAVTGTIAAEIDGSSEDSVQTVGSVSVELIKQKRQYNGDKVVLSPIESFDTLYPIYGSVQYDGSNFDEYGMPTAAGYMDYIIRVKNTGDSPAYVRVLFAIPSALDDENSLGNKALHWNMGNHFMPEGSFTAINTENKKFADIVEDFSEKTVIDGIESNVYTFTYQTALQPGEITPAAAVVGFYLDSAVNVVDGEIILDGESTGFFNQEIPIFAAAQAVQTENFDDANMAFSAINLPYPQWTIPKQ